VAAARAYVASLLTMESARVMKNTPALLVSMTYIDATPTCSATVSSVIYCDIRMLATQTESHASVVGTTPKGDSESS